MQGVCIKSRIQLGMAPNYLGGHNDIILNSQKFGAFAHAMSLSGQEVPEIRVITWNNPPFLFASSRFRDEFDNEYMQISGPLYSLVKEVAARLNYR